MRSRLFTAAVAATLSLSLTPAIANAEPAPVTGVELNQAVEQSVAVDATFDFDAAEKVGLPALRQLRADMWDKNPYYMPFFEKREPGTLRLRDVAAEKGYPTKEAYVNAVQLDHGLTRIAIQGAAEASSTFAHERPDGSKSDTATYNGLSGWGESLAAGRDLRSSILDGWGGKKEYDALIKSRGVNSPGNGHLHHLLNPDETYFGFSEVRVPNTKYGTYTVARSLNKPTNGETLESGKQRVWLYRLAKSDETPTGIKAGVPGPVNQAPGNSLGLGEGSSSELITIIGIVFGVLSLLGAIAGIAKQLGLI